jgi:hypothetical protein
VAENAKGRASSTSLRYVASFTHNIVRAHSSIDHDGCTKGVEMKTPSSSALHCHRNGMVSSPTHTEIEVTDRTEIVPWHCLALLARTSR